jgi:hypothetical protein
MYDRPPNICENLQDIYGNDNLVIVTHIWRNLAYRHTYLAELHWFLLILCGHVILFLTLCQFPVALILVPGWIGESIMEDEE